MTSKRPLGGHIGSKEGLDAYLYKKVSEWKQALPCMLTQLAKTQPQNACAALTISLQCEWDYTSGQRVVPDCGTNFESLAELLSRNFINELVNSEGGEDERSYTRSPLSKADWGSNIVFYVKRREARKAKEALQKE